MLFIWITVLSWIFPHFVFHSNSKQNIFTQWRTQRFHGKGKYLNSFLIFVYILHTNIIFQYLHSPSPFSYISFEIDIVFIWNYKMHVCCKTNLIRFFIYKYLLFYTAALPRWRQGLTYLAVPSKLKYDVCRKMFSSKY
jgi:hypothetical protein